MSRPTSHEHGAHHDALVNEALGVAREVAEFVESRRGAVIEVSSKFVERDGATVEDVVTDVDVTAERLARDLIQRCSAGARILGEEAGLGDDTSADASLAEADDLWLVDPLDGTANFTRGLPLFTVSVARLRRGAIREAAIIAPALREEYALDAHGVASWKVGDHEPQPMRVASTTSLDEAFVGGGLFHERVAPLLSGRIGHGRRIGSAALALAWVAAGRIDAYLQPAGLAPWDIAAGIPMVRAAGGVVRTMTGDELAVGFTGTIGVVAAASGIDDSLQHALRDV